MKKVFPPSNPPVSLFSGGKLDTYLDCVCAHVKTSDLVHPSQFTWPWGNWNLGRLNDLAWDRQLASSCLNWRPSIGSHRIPVFCCQLDIHSLLVHFSGKCCYVPWSQVIPLPTPHPPAFCRLASGCEGEDCKDSGGNKAGRPVGSVNRGKGQKSEKDALQGSR